MLIGMDWLVKTEHLLIRGHHGGWVAAQAPADENLVAVDQFDPEAGSVVRVSVEEDCQAREWQSAAADRDELRRTVVWAHKCASDRAIRIQVLLIEGKCEETCIGSVRPKAGDKPADAKWDASLLMTVRSCKVGRIQIPPILQNVLFPF